MRKITAKDANEFSRVWRHNGVSIVFQDVYLQFAADFANVAIQSFIEEAQRVNAARAAAAAAPKVVVANN